MSSALQALHPRRTVPAFASLLMAGAAHAHHGMDGQMPQTLAQGLISGLAHPVIGPDHLAFLIGLGWLLSRLGSRVRVALAAAFVVGSFLGTALHLQSVDLPVSELLVALSVLGVGLVLMLRRAPPATWLAAALPVAGLLHGYAYGEAIVGAEATPLAAYLLGFGLIQFAVVTALAFWLARAPDARNQRLGYLAGAAVVGLGAWFTVSQLGSVLA